MPMISSKTLINNFLLSVHKGTVSKIYSKKQTDKNGNRFLKEKKYQNAYKCQYFYL